ncbi:SHOCT domain-containing protein [Halobacterium sp. R2-5]|uniref:SHOCT domain-containing protein n=1 Tax=Halobacterium sp. R2-5 TaxID=2715751 RepID=UPI001422AD62|nr:SHOCT domain-containing protein [Halobacterium sp. R2-5]NIB98488.1 SHOCT domain-containing protein [Halobacterium sp. R2-5]
MARQHSTGRFVAGALAVIAAVVAVPALAGGLGGTAAPMHHAAGGHVGGYAMGGGWLGLGGPVWWLLLAAVAGVGLLAFSGRDDTDGDDALAAARRAYARGDLTDEEYERRREALRTDD